MSYTAIGSGSITLNAMSAEEQKNLQEALMNRYDRLRTADLAQCGDDMAYQIEREYQELTQAMLKYNDPFCRSCSSFSARWPLQRPLLVAYGCFQRGGVH